MINHFGFTVRTPLYDGRLRFRDVRITSQTWRDTGARQSDAFNLACKQTRAKQTRCEHCQHWLCTVYTVHNGNNRLSDWTLPRFMNAKAQQAAWTVDRENVFT